MMGSSEAEDRLFIFLYGPPGAGKSLVARHLAQALDLPFVDLDQEIEAAAGKPAHAIFTTEGESGFRSRERMALRRVVAHNRAVVALGGGALLDAENRSLVDSHGRTLCLTAPHHLLLARLQHSEDKRPLLMADLANELADLLSRRAGHYASFPLQLDTASLSPEEASWQAQVLLGAFHTRGMGSGYDVRVLPGGLITIGDALRWRDFQSPVALVSDNRVAGLYAGPVQTSLEGAGYIVHPVVFPEGERYKNIDTLRQVWSELLAGGLERSSTLVALGGGVVGDLTGFAAATFLRGLRWAFLPTTLLAMVDASLGGKTGVDLPEGKNLVGAFHPPGLVLVDPQVLASLPSPELRAGMAEVVKHGLIGDPQLFRRCSRGMAALEGAWDEVVRHAMAVKIRVIQDDPFEKGPREALNLGHTIGHAVELASGYNLRHGEAVAIGLAMETRLAVWLGLAEPELEDQVVAVLQGLGLPTAIPGDLSRETILQAMHFDKKRRKGQVRFALPERIGHVRIGVQVDDPSILHKLLKPV